MLRLFIHNFMRLVLLLFFVSVVAFALVTVSPIDPLQVNIGQQALATLSKEQVEKLQTYWGVNDPPVQRYLVWAGDFVRGDMGVSLRFRQSVASVIGEKLSKSMLLIGFAWIVSGLFGYALGVIAAVNEGKFIDKLIKNYALVMASTPVFWLALVFLLVFAVWLKLFPIGLGIPIGLDTASVTWLDKLRHAVLPAFVLSITGISPIVLHTRAKMIDVMQSDYVLFARARGGTAWGIVRRHGLRNTLLPTLTLQFASIGEILGGSILVEQVFSYPGLGQATVAAGLGGDVPLLMGIAIMGATLVFLGNFIANMLYAVVDPRMSRGAKA